jgi:hypothetical protein
MEESVPFLSRQYLFFAGLLLLARGLDFLSTWIATPHLVLEGNPIARKLGWRWGALVNLALCGVFGLFPLPALIIVTTSVLVAAHNFDGAWLMHSMGEETYRSWIAQRHLSARASLYLFCLCAKTSLWGLVGGALLAFGQNGLVATGIGFGMVGYAAAVLIYSLISVWRLRGIIRHRSP